MGVRGDRIQIAMTKLAQKIDAAIGEGSVYQTATAWNIPHWIIRDTLSGKIDCPSPKYLRQVAAGLGCSVEEVIEDAYTPAPEADAVAI